MVRFWVSTIVALVFSTAALAHSGGLDKKGCHLDHKTGVYHCH